MFTGPILQGMPRKQLLRLKNPKLFPEPCLLHQAGIRCVLAGIFPGHLKTGNILPQLQTAERCGFRKHMQFAGKPFGKKYQKPCWKCSPFQQLNNPFLQHIHLPAGARNLYLLWENLCLQTGQCNCCTSTAFHNMYFPGRMQKPPRTKTTLQITLPTSFPIPTYSENCKI